MSSIHDDPPHQHNRSCEVMSKTSGRPCQIEYLKLIRKIEVVEVWRIELERIDASLEKTDPLSVLTHFKRQSASNFNKTIRWAISTGLPGWWHDLCRWGNQLWRFGEELFHELPGPLADFLKRVCAARDLHQADMMEAATLVLHEDLKKARRRQQDLLQQMLSTIELLQSSAVKESPLPNPKDLASGQEIPTQKGATLEVNGIINEMAIVAVPDTGSCFNVISERIATSMGLKAIPGTHGQMLLPNGAKVMSPGHVQVAFNFDGENETHSLLCSILPRATRDLVLGGAFLKATKTMTLYTHRLRRTICNLAQPSLNLIGADQDILGGYINGRECLAVPDTGSDVMAISLKHARRMGLKIHRKDRHRTLVEFLDGSRVRTKGIAQAEWQFAYGEAPIRYGFHVIKGLPVDAILNNTMLDQYDVFRQYEERIGSSESLQSTISCGIYGISLVEICEQKIRSLSDSYMDDIKSDNPFTPEKVERERARRDEIRDTISQIPDEALRATKQHQEYLRKRIWDELRKPHLQANTSPGSTSDTNSKPSHISQGSRGVYLDPEAIQSSHIGARQLEEGLAVDDSNSVQATRRTRTGLKALGRLFR